LSGERQALAGLTRVANRQRHGVRATTSRRDGEAAQRGEGNMTTRPKLDFTYTQAPAQHWARRREILAQHPEVRALMTPHPGSALWIVALVCGQGLVAFLLRDAHWLVVLALAYVLGAFVSHALYVQIHECTHNLVTGRSLFDRLLGLVCDLALFFPSALAFRKYHLLHHKHLGHRELDPDVVSRAEGDLVGNVWWRKAIWMFSLSISQALRPYKVKTVAMWDGWIAANLAIVVVVDVAVLYGFGLKALAYLAFSTLFALGLHPLGGRWVQEHYVTTPGQETYSYYGILNRVCFNMGFHNEHHDFPNVPWNNLPKLTQAAPEQYRSLKSYRSWTAVLLNFIFNPEMSAFSRIVRADPK
jgi:sphingolipid delta-4 desaturase